MMNFKQKGKVSQSLIILILLLLSGVLSVIIWFSSGHKETDEHGHGHEEEAESEHGHEQEEGEHADEGEIQLSTQQMVEQGLKLVTVEQGLVEKVTTLPGKLVVNTDQQAHISPNFSGHVEQVNVSLGQKVEKGQILAVLSVPELIDQQANLQMAHSTLELARQEYQREQQLWSQGISPKQDLQRAEYAYRQAQISTQATQSRLKALGASGNQGQFMIKAPISGVISQKDIVVGENVQLANQLFIIDQLDQLWLEFIVPSDYLTQLSPNQVLNFKSLQTGNNFQAKIQTLSAEADAQTGRLQVRAQVMSQAPELRPNLMVNIELSQANKSSALRVAKEAIQQVEGKSVVFVATDHGQKVAFKPQEVEVGGRTSDDQWVEIKSGLKAGERYVSQGSFLLKSEMEKGEADHGH